MNPATKKQKRGEEKAKVAGSGRVERKGLLKVSAIFVRNESQARTEGKGGRKRGERQTRGEGNRKSKKEQGVRLRQIALVRMKQSQTRRLESSKAEGWEA